MPPAGPGRKREKPIAFLLGHVVAFKTDMPHTNKADLDYPSVSLYNELRPRLGFA
jgi:hypothetical protein